MQQTWLACLLRNGSLDPSSLAFLEDQLVHGNMHRTLPVWSLVYLPGQVWNEEKCCFDMRLISLVIQRILIRDIQEIQHGGHCGQGVRNTDNHTVISHKTWKAFYRGWCVCWVYTLMQDELHSTVGMGVSALLQSRFSWGRDSKSLPVGELLRMKSSLLVTQWGFSCKFW